jgi:hypothetical protein
MRPDRTAAIDFGAPRGNTRAAVVNIVASFRIRFGRDLFDVDNIIA